MYVKMDLNRNDLEALLRHAQQHVPATGDFREDQRLADALLTLVEALQNADKLSAS